MDQNGASTQIASAVAVVESQVISPALTVNDIILCFLEYGANYYSKEGRELEQFKLSLRPLREVCGPLSVSSFGPKALKSVQRRMVEHERVVFGNGIINREHLVPTLRGRHGCFSIQFLGMFGCYPACRRFESYPGRWSKLMVT